MKKIHRDILTLPALLLAAALLTLTGCALDAPDEATGPLNPINPPGVEDAGARYVAVGNSLTAGYMDGGLVQAGQANSYPNLIARQLGLSSAQFTQPWIAAPGIGTSTSSDPQTLVAGVLYFNGTGIAILDETPRAEVPALLLARTQPTQYHNLGVPGAKLHDGMHAYSSTTWSGYVTGHPESENAFFNIVNRATFFGNRTIDSGYPLGSTFVPVTYESASQFYQAVAKGGALTTLWLGNNDVLGPAMSGEPAAGFGAAAAPAFQSDFTALLSMLAGGLRQRNNGLKPTIIVANIPNVADTPYFIPKAVFETAIGGGWPGGYDPDEVLDGGIQYVLFPALSWVRTHGTSTPIPASLTLSALERTDVEAATGTFNTIISQVRAGVNASGIANVGLMDANSILAGLAAPQKTHFLFLVGQGLSVTQAAATTMFSLDGVHPNSHGYGLLANAYIDKINEIDGTNLAHVDPAALPWDPTYGQTPAKANVPLGLDPGAAAAMANLFR
jgi:hypothetical protein